KITDFGVAKFLSHQATQSGVVLGTPSYMSPEQIADRPTDGRADQFALAVIAYQLLTGEKPFAGNTLPSLMFKIVNEEFLPAQRINPTLGGGVDIVLRRALHKEAQQRFPSCVEFTRALANACQSKPGWEPMKTGAVESLETVAEAIPVALSTALPFPRQEPAPLPEASAPVSSSAQAAPVQIRPRLFREEETTGRERRSSRWKSPIAFLAGLVTIGLVLMLGRQLLFHNDSGSGAAAQSQPQETSNDATKPSAMGPAVPPPPPPASEPGSTGGEEKSESPSDEPKGRQTAEAKPAEPQPPSPQPTTSQPPNSQPPNSQPPNSQPATTVREKPAEELPYHVATVPPGAKIIFDGVGARSCTAPCQMTLSAGRHTLTAALDGHRLQSRIFNLPQDREILITMERSVGTLTIRTTPSGATIILNGQERREKTPASLTLPTGRYRIELVKEGQRKEQYDVEVKDGVVSNIDVAWTQ
ncbi:MAG: PEGA domain-containing protein, partial [Bryobacterales bacterium]|nr:PEGA domain-containing protein [Bryobacterales bacterium]